MLTYSLVVTFSVDKFRKRSMLLLYSLSRIIELVYDCFLAPKPCLTYFGMGMFRGVDAVSKAC